jgi:hypothetical protein
MIQIRNLTLTNVLDLHCPGKQVEQICLGELVHECQWEGGDGDDSRGWLLPLSAEGSSPVRCHDHRRILSTHALRGNATKDKLELSQQRIRLTRLELEVHLRKEMNKEMSE